MTWLRSHDALVVLLAVTTGATDAAAFERLGHAFASVITGNLVLVGVGAARGDGLLALFSGCALIGYAVGVLAAAPRRGETKQHGDRWPKAARSALVADLALLASFALVWELVRPHPGTGMQLLLLLLAAAAMGVQSTAIRRLGPISTTYLTSTFVGIFEALAARSWSREHGRSVAILVAALVGAAAATALLLYARRLLPLLQLLPVLIVIIASRRL